MEWLLVGIIWAVCAVACYYIAKSKDDPSPTTWAAAGVLLGPIGVIATWMMASPREAA